MRLTEKLLNTQAYFEKRGLVQRFDAQITFFSSIRPFEGMM